MPFRKISRDLKFCAIRLYEREVLSLEEILDCVGFSERTFYRILSLYRATGDVVKQNPSTAGRSRLLHFDDIDYLLRLLRQRPDWFLDELLDLLQTNRFISAHYVTIHRTLVQAGASRKKLRKIAAERNEEGRNDFIHRMAQYDPQELGFIDETSKNDKTASRTHGRARKGHRAVVCSKFIRGVRLTATALLTIDGIAVARVVEGSMTRDLYLHFLEHDIVSAWSIHYLDLLNS